MKKPTVLLPTMVKGIISGPIRCLSLDGDEIWLPPKKGILRIEPFEQNGKWFAVSHLQKKSRFFSLLYSPFIFHVGKFWKLQETETLASGVVLWKPGTERGIYTRTPGFRWQQPDAVSEMTPWIFSFGYLGGHLD